MKLKTFEWVQVGKEERGCVEIHCLWTMKNGRIMRSMMMAPVKGYTCPFCKKSTDGIQEQKDAFEHINQFRAKEGGGWKDNGEYEYDILKRTITKIK